MTNLETVVKRYDDLQTGDVFSWGGEVVWFVRKADGSDADIVGGWASAGGHPEEVEVIPAAVPLARLIGELAGRPTSIDAAELERLREANREFLRWRDRLVEDAHAYADENNLCSEFDRFMEEHDLPTRVKEFNVTITLTVEARDDDDAVERVSGNYYYTSDLIGAAYVEAEVA